ncbi:MAG TPA: sarcosine oxidase subunit gamma family protein [Solirubrobacteraceae bacterium]|nr:sarcosine oxidase subunit gamma family protein [Solirubrobacteraceae bacterium]
MSALAFLTPDAVGGAPARSPMHRLASAAGARARERDGWQIASGYPDPGVERARLGEGVAFVDRSSLCKLELHAGAPELRGVVAQASGGVRLEPRAAARSSDGTWWCPVTPSRVLALAEPGRAATVRAAALAAAGGPLEVYATVVDVTCGLAALTLAGPLAAELLARFCAIDVRPEITPVGGFRPGSIARTPGYLLREREDELLVLVGWALGEYLWTVVADAAERLGGGPVGADALAEHRERAGA